jgi:small subunit ribosomal protein S3Ae
MVVAPPVFGEAQLGLTPADDPDKLIGRVMEATLYDITGDFAHIHIKLYFQIIKVEGDTAYTRFKGHELLRDYIRGLTRRKTSKITGIFNVWTKDGYGLRVTAMVFTRYRCKSSQKRLIRKRMQEVIVNRAAQSTLDEFIEAMVFSDREGSLAQEIEEAARKMEAIIEGMPGIEIISTTIGSEPGIVSFGTGRIPQQGMITAHFVDRFHRKKTIWELEEEIRRRGQIIAGIRSLDVFDFGATPLSSIAAPVDIMISGPDAAVLDRIGAEVERRLWTVRGLKSVSRSWYMDKVEMLIRIDLEKAQRCL